MAYPYRKLLLTLAIASFATAPALAEDAPAPAADAAPAATAAPAASADDSVSAPADAAPAAAAPAPAAPATPVWHGNAALSYIVQNGNSVSRAVYGKGEIGRDWRKWAVSLKGEGGSTQTRNATSRQLERTAEKYYGELREERKLDDLNYIYHLTTYLNDNFSGYEYQLTDSLGYGRTLFKTATQQLDFEAGPGYRVRKLEHTTPVPPATVAPHGKEEDGILHLGAKYFWQITQSTKFTENLQDDIGKLNWTVRAETGLTTLLNSHLAFSVTHLVTRTSEVPDGTHKSDSQVTLSLVYTYK